jgi:hypothetical protein
MELRYFDRAAPGVAVERLFVSDRRFRCGISESCVCYSGDYSKHNGQVGEMGFVATLGSGRIRVGQMNLLQRMAILDRANEFAATYSNVRLRGQVRLPRGPGVADEGVIPFK